MSEPLVIKDSIVDAWLDQANDKTRKKAARLHMRNNSGSHRNIYIIPAKGWPRDATKMVESLLGFKNGEAWAGAVQVTVRLVAEKWDIDKIKYSKQPAVVGPSATMTKTGAAANTLWEMDVTSLVQYAMDSGFWFGFRLTVDSSSDKWIHSSEAKRDAWRPYLSVEWSEAPEAPDNLQPGGENSVSLQFPPFSYDHNDTLGSTDITMQELEIFAEGADVDVDSPEFTTGQIAASEPEWTSAGSAWAGVTAGTGKTWRVRTKDDSEWSPWSDPETFYRTAKSSLTLGAITSLKTPTPTITWTFGGTQTAFRVAVALASNPRDWLWSSGKLSGNDSSYTIPFGAITDPNETYVIHVHVWDNVSRVAVQGDPEYTGVSSGNLAVTFDGAVTNIAALDLDFDVVFPVATLTFTRSATPDEFFLLRSFDNTEWEYVNEYDPAEISTGGTGYEIIDNTAPSYRPVWWRVVPVVAGVQGTGLTTNGQVRRKAPMLFTPEGDDPCVFLNPSRSRTNNDVQEVYFPMSGDPVVVTQKLGRKMGKVSGYFAPESMAGVTPEEMLKSFRAHRKRKGQTVIVSTGNESFLAVPFNFNDDIVIDGDGIYYYAEFEWVEVGLGA